MKKTILLCCLICFAYGCKKESKAYPRTTLPGTTWRETHPRGTDANIYEFIKFDTDIRVSVTFTGADGNSTDWSAADCVIHIDNQKNMDTFEIIDPFFGNKTGTTTANVNQIIVGGETFDRFN